MDLAVDQDVPQLANKLVGQSCLPLPPSLPPSLHPSLPPFLPPYLPLEAVCDSRLILHLKTSLGPHHRFTFAN
ncbi:hypothetical protein J6590_041601 [Homalodisca vitripennis]|nr:hypothetical protein J6590_041601 [Homalodisca vitripennis]